MRELCACIDRAVFRRFSMDLFFPFSYFEPIHSVALRLLSSLILDSDVFAQSACFLDLFLDGKIHSWVHSRESGIFQMRKHLSDGFVSYQYRSSRVVNEFVSSQRLKFLKREYGRLSRASGTLSPIQRAMDFFRKLPNLLCTA